MKNLKFIQSGISRLFVLFLCVGVMGGSSFGWNKPGHMVTGAIAYQELQAADPAAVNRIVALLKTHPFYQEHWRSIVAQNPGFDEGLILFAHAARWADDARDTEDHREYWHFINHPFKPAGQPDSVRTYPPRDDNIENAFQTNLNVLSQATSSDEDKTKALLWIFHLAGDAHQPLHSTTIFTTVFRSRQGDRGGTRFYIRFTDASSPLSLHKIWDGAVIGSERLQSVRNTAVGLRQQYRKNSFPNVSESRFPVWIQESVALAKEKAYLNGSLEGGRSASSSRVLPSGYRNEMTRTAEPQMTLAGYRLADLLSRNF